MGNFIAVGERGSDEVELDFILTIVPSLLANVSAALCSETGAVLFTAAAAGTDLGAGGE